MKDVFPMDLISMVGVVFLVFVFLVLFGLIIWSELTKSNPSDKYGGYRGSPTGFYDLYMGVTDELDQMTEEEWGEWDTWMDDQERQAEILNQKMLADLKKKAELEAQRKAEQEAIERDFPAWLVELGEEFGVTTYRKLALLTLYIQAILDYGRDNFRGTLPIRKCYQAAQEKCFGDAPTSSCYGRAFFERVSWVMTRKGLLINDARGTKGRSIAPEAWLKLRPASSQLHPSVQNGKE